MIVQQTELFVISETILFETNNWMFIKNVIFYVK